VIKWAVIGTGQISRSIVPDMIQVGLDVHVVQSRDEAKAAAFAREFSIPRWESNFRAVLDDPAVKAVYIATPIATHARMATQAILAGKHVLVEKPLATTAAEVDELFVLARNTGVFLMEAMWMKFNPAYRRLHAELKADALGGPPTFLRAGFAIPFPEESNPSRWDVTLSGGALLDQAIYPVTLAHSLFGPPTRITAGGRVREDGLDLSEHVTLEYDDGRFAQFFTAMDEFGDCSASVGGPKGWLTLPPPFWATTDLEIHTGSFRTIFHSPDLRKNDREGNGFVPMLRAVAEALDNNLVEQPLHGAADTSAVFATLDAIRRQLGRRTAEKTATTSSHPR